MAVHNPLDVLQIVPAVPPAIDGVGDYAFAVSQKMEAMAAVRSELFCPDMRTCGYDDARLMGEFLRRARGRRTLVLQYSGYGYSDCGAPLWLAEGISRWKQDSSGQRRLVTVFHELYASGRIWSRSFWFSPRQRRVARRLAQLSDAILTSSQLHADVLRGWNSGIQIAILPIPSNVGEVDQLTEGRREPIIAVFGQRGNKTRLFLENRRNWDTVRSRLPETVIHDLGPGTGLDIKKLTGLPAREHGTVAKTEVSERLSSALHGALDYGQMTLEKSGVFAALCSHGVVPIVFRYQSSKNSTLREGDHFVSPHAISPSMDSFTRIARNAHRWYMEHNLERHACVMSSLVRGWNV